MIIYITILAKNYISYSKIVDKIVWRWSFFYSTLFSLRFWFKVVVTVEDRTDGPSFIFNCNCWIGKDKNDLQKYLTPEKHGKWRVSFSFQAEKAKIVNIIRMEVIMHFPRSCCIFYLWFFFSLFWINFIIVDGNWSPWSQWSGCGSGLCGGNKKVRTRSCTNPHPTGGGKACPGDSIEEGSCPSMSEIKSTFLHFGFAIHE